LIIAGRMSTMRAEVAAQEKEQEKECQEARRVTAKAAVVVVQELELEL